MTSGYRVTATFFVPADPQKPETMAQAFEVMKVAEGDIGSLVGVIDLEMSHRFISRRKQSAASLAAEQVIEKNAGKPPPCVKHEWMVDEFGPDVCGVCGDQRPNSHADEMPPLPPALDRRGKA